MARVGFIGLGVMGRPMAGYLVKAGHEVTIYNRSPAKAVAFIEEFPTARQASTLAQLALDSEIVLTCVGADPDLAEIVLGPEGIFAHCAPGTLYIDHTTASAQMACRLSQEGARRGIGVIDAPVSGGQAGAEGGTLTIMCGGTPEHFAVAKEVMASYGKKMVLVGAAGSGQLTKMVNQICIAGVVQGLAEALALGLRSGLDMGKVLEAIGQGAAQSWQMDNRAQTMCANAFDFGFAVDWMRKDLEMCLAQAKACGARLPMTALVDQFYGQIQGAGGRRWDTSSLIEPLMRS